MLNKLILGIAFAVCAFSSLITMSCSPRKDSAVSPVIAKASISSPSAITLTMAQVEYLAKLAESAKRFSTVFTYELEARSNGAINVHSVRESGFVMEVFDEIIGADGKEIELTLR